MEKDQKYDGNLLKYQLLAEASIAAVAGQPDDQILRRALDNAIEVLGLVTGSIRLMDDSGKVTFFQVSGRDEFSEMMRQIEIKMLAVLRDDFKVKSVFLTFEEEGNYSLFSYPLKLGDKIFGTIAGITPGERSLATEEDFIKAISSVLVLVLSRGREGKATPRDEIVKAKAEAVVETAVAINHEVNNPLTAVLGNIQLLLLNAEGFSPEIKAKLKAVEESALRIKEVTQNLMRVIEPSVIEYTTGIKMVDLKKSLLSKEADDKKKSE